MKISEHCFPCLLKQIIKTAGFVEYKNIDELFRESFKYLSNADYSKTSPEISGDVYRILSKKFGIDDPYKELKDFYNNLFYKKLEKLEEKPLSFNDAVKYAVLGNIVDFSAVKVNIDEDIEELFSSVESLEFAVDDSAKLLEDVKKAKSILYLGDNCGEICLDKLLIKQIKKINPCCKIYYGVRGTPAGNDNTEEDALSVKMDDVAEIISNGDCSLGTVLDRTSPAFRSVYESADVIISKGQGNYESLSEEQSNIYFLLMIKCPVIAEYVGVPERSLVCMKNKFK